MRFDFLLPAWVGKHYGVQRIDTPTYINDAGEPAACTVRKLNMRFDQAQTESLMHWTLAGQFSTRARAGVFTINPCWFAIGRAIAPHFTHIYRITVELSNNEAQVVARGITR